jgi:hypothetical protein
LGSSYPKRWNGSIGKSSCGLPYWRSTFFRCRGWGVQKLPRLRGYRQGQKARLKHSGFHTLFKYGNHNTNPFKRSTALQDGGIQFASAHLEENERAIKAVSIFLGLTNKETARLPLKVLNKAIEHIKNILSESPELQPTFEYKGIKYGFVPNLDDLTTGEFIDIEAYQKEPKDTFKVLSVLYRPITKEGQGNRYLIAPIQRGNKRSV